MNMQVLANRLKPIAAFDWFNDRTAFLAEEKYCIKVFFSNLGQQKWGYRCDNYLRSI